VTLLTLFFGDFGGKRYKKGEKMAFFRGFKGQNAGCNPYWRGKKIDKKLSKRQLGELWLEQGTRIVFARVWEGVECAMG